MGESKQPENLIGRWRITHMSLWDADFVDADGPAFIQLAADGRGEFRFGYVHCGIDWWAEAARPSPAAEFSFEGSDEMDPTSGRGSVAMQPDGTIEGHLHFHRGDDSSFRAERIADAAPAPAQDS